MSDDLFKKDLFRPLAARMRPTDLDSVVGQEHLVGRGNPLREAIDSGALHSMILWGPPGVGKTTLARLIARSTDANFENISAVLSGVKEIRAAIANAKEQRDLQAKQTVLFVDEVHRFNKSQQDAFLPFVEDGTLVFVGATTENPSFELNNALLSRCRVYVLKSLNQGDIETVLVKAMTDKKVGLGRHSLQLDEQARQLLASAADGDARRALNLLEIASDLVIDQKSLRAIDKKTVEQVLVEGARRFDKGGEYFFDQISALHKSVRGSSPDAALYWLCRMLDGGCDPMYIARRLVRMASEDIGNADPRALQIAMNAWDAQIRIGSPEGELALAQATIFLAVAAKSNASYSAFNAAMKDIRSLPSYEVPKHLRNAPTPLMQKLDYGKDYRYAHNEKDAYAAGECYLPDELVGRKYYFPTDQGLEKKIGEKLDYLRAKDDQAKDE